MGSSNSWTASHLADVPGSNPTFIPRLRRATALLGHGPRTRHGSIECEGNIYQRRLGQVPPPIRSNFIISIAARPYRTTPCQSALPQRFWPHHSPPDRTTPIHLAAQPPPRP